MGYCDSKSRAGNVCYGAYLLRDNNIISRASKILRQKRHSEIVNVKKSKTRQINFPESCIQSKRNIILSRSFQAICWCEISEMNSPFIKLAAFKFI